MIWFCLFPQGGVTLYGLKYNIAVGVLFINAWLSGETYTNTLGKRHEMLALTEVHHVLC